MKTSQDLMDEMLRAARDPFHELRQSLPPEIAGRLTPGKAKDFPTHARYIAATFGMASLAEVNITRLVPEFAQEIERYLQANGRGEGVRRNTRNTYRLLRDVAIAKGLLPPDLCTPGIPKRNQLFLKREGRRSSLRAPLRKTYSRHGIRQVDFNPTLKQEMEALRRYYTARVVLGRKSRALDASTWKAHCDRIERFFGAMVQLGYPHEEATLRDFVNLDRLQQYIEFFLAGHDDVATYTLKDQLSWAHNIAKNFFNDKSLADDISGLINQMRYVRIKDHDHLVMKVSAQDLYHLEDMLIQHALAYDHQHYRRKPGRAILYPQAMVAWHYGRALAIMLANRCWFRRSNLFGIVWNQHLYYYEGKLHFKFSAHEMKSKEPHMGQVVDLWHGQAGYNRLVQVLERYLEVRHHLIEKLRQNHPSASEPKELILNIGGEPYGGNGGWAMFSSVSRAYLGNDKEIHPHAPRLIMPTYLMLEFDYALLSNIQALLDHKSIQTTERHYLRMKRLMNGQAAQRVMDERVARERQAASIEKMERMLVEMRSQLFGKAISSH